MRTAFSKQNLHARGLTAKLLLQRYLLPVDFDELVSLLDDYPDSVIEFSNFNQRCGIIPHRNMIVWEVRNY